MHIFIDMRWLLASLFLLSSLAEAARSKIRNR